jgi:hypothetical protein
MEKEVIRQHILKSGVKNLKEFGYPDANTNNILTDEVYKLFFESMLKENLGYNKQTDEVLNDILRELNNQ